MDFGSGILYVFIALLTFLVDSAIGSLTDAVESKDNFKKRIKKYSIASLIFVCLYFIIYYLMTKTSKFNFTSEDGVALLIVFVTSILYFFLNATVSTFTKNTLEKRHVAKIKAKEEAKVKAEAKSKKIAESVTIESNDEIKSEAKALITKPKPKETDRRELLWVYMIIFNVLMIVAILLLNSILLRGNNYINKDTRATLTMGCEKYEIVIPKDTLFTVEYSAQNQKTNNPIDKIFNFQVNRSEYKMRKGTSITLLEDTFLQAGEELSINLVNNKEVSDVDFYTNDKSAIKLKREKTVELSEDSVVLLQQQNSYLAIALVSLYTQILMLIIYYPIKHQYNL
ncbi:hypothetical protein QM909_05850 [Streptococcus gordonii]|uniref:hypothetical protein n=1 Tax=Streptococcus gordonii TaxID=1302 RepID=UPI0039C0DC07